MHATESTKEVGSIRSGREVRPWDGGSRERVVTSESVGSVLVELLRRVAGGTAQADLDGAPFAVIDGEKRNLTVQIAPLLEATQGERSARPEVHFRLWEERGVPSALARSGWHVSVRDGPHEMIRLGRDVSALTGHVHVSPTALWKLRRFV